MADHHPYHRFQAPLPPAVAVVGHSDVGKTTLIEQLIPALSKKGYRIGTMKHAHHGFDMDRSGKDTWRHQMAGAETVLVASPSKIAMIKRTDGNRPEALLTYFHDRDLVIVEGFKKSVLPKIEVFRRAVEKAPICLDDDRLVALVTDDDIPAPVPVFGFDEVDALAAHIESTLLAFANGQ